VSTDPLYPFQEAAAASAATGQQVYLGFDPGLGKSRTAIETAKRRKVRRMLVVCPASGRYVWASEMKKWWPDMPVTVIRGPADLGFLRNPGVIVLTYGLLSIKEGPFVSGLLKTPKFDMAVIDEAAFVKNPGSNRTRAILGKLLGHLGYVLPMSGTPAPNHAGELYPILKALHPAAITDGSGVVMNQWQFEDAYCKVVQKRFGQGPSVRVIEGSKNLAGLREKMNGFMLRVRKEDVLDELPDIRYDVVPIAPTPNVIGNLPQLPAFASDEEFLKYLAGAAGDVHVMRLRHLLGLAKLQPAVEYIDDFLQNLNPHKKVLVFAHHKDVVEGLHARLRDHHPTLITGSTTTVERAKAIDDFLMEPRCRLMVGNIQAMGTGLTLVGPNCRCSDVIFVEASYAVGDNVQAAARVHRIGQYEGVVARFLTAHGTIDDRIQSILARKAKDFHDLFN